MQKINIEQEVNLLSVSDIALKILVLTEVMYADISIWEVHNKSHADFNKFFKIMLVPYLISMTLSFFVKLPDDAYVNFMLTFILVMFFLGLTASKMLLLKKQNLIRKRMQELKLLSMQLDVIRSGHVKVEINLVAALDLIRSFSA